MMFSAENPLWSDCGAMFVGAAQMQQFQRRTEWTPAVAVQHSNYLPVNYSQSLHTHTRARAHRKKWLRKFLISSRITLICYFTEIACDHEAESHQRREELPPAVSQRIIVYFSFYGVIHFKSAQVRHVRAHTHARHLTISTHTDNCRKTSLRSKSVFP